MKNENSNQAVRMVKIIGKGLVVLCGSVFMLGVISGIAIVNQRSKNQLKKWDAIDVD